jgi:peptidoglycan/LPS O-acetylase OafA/YrhL
MIISIINAVAETRIIEVFLLLAILASTRLVKKDQPFFSVEITAELKGLAILMVIFAHVGYFLVDDHRFLVPLSNYGGVGVDLFLILSGYGLVAAAVRRPISISVFYLKRLTRVYIPVLITLALFLLLDFFVLHRTYPIKSIIENMLGFFPQADIYGNINSPLWYITPLLFYYIVFPLIFWRRLPLLSALAMAIIGWLVVRHIPDVHSISEVVVKLYKLHFLAFPLGMAMGAVINQSPAPVVKLVRWLGLTVRKYHLTIILRLVLIFLAVYIFMYTSDHSHIGEGWKKESITSLYSAMSLVAIFVFKKINVKVLSLLGLFSFEIYLLHWPLLYRYDFIYGHMPAGAATIISVVVLLGSAYAYHHVIVAVFNLIKPASPGNLS